MRMYRLVVSMAAASLLTIVLPVSSYSQQVRDHRHKPSTINPPPSVSKDGGKRDRNPGGVSVTQAKIRESYKDPKTGETKWRFCNPGKRLGRC
jgi:hypothetical protein